MAETKDVEASDYPKKLFYKINEVAKITGIEAYVLRYWESKFPMLAPEKDSGDQRRYRQTDIEMVQRIKQLLYHEKYTIAGALEKLTQEKTERKKSSRGKKSENQTPDLMLIVEPDEAQDGKSDADAAKAVDGSPSVEGAEELSSVPTTAVSTASLPVAASPVFAEFRKGVSTVRKQMDELITELKEWRAQQ